MNTTKTALHVKWTSKYMAAAAIFENGTSHALKKVARTEMRAYEEGLRVLHSWIAMTEVASSLRNRMNSPMRRAQRPFFISMLHDIELAREHPEAEAAGEVTDES